jgi:hypothetical protein
MNLSNDVMNLVPLVLAFPACPLKPQTDQSKPVLAWPLLKDETGLMVQRGSAEAFHLEEARFRAIDGGSLKWCWATKTGVLCGKAGTDAQRMTDRDDLWLMVRADNPVVRPPPEVGVQADTIENALGGYVVPVAVASKLMPL